MTAHKKLLVDRQLQGTLVLRIVAYWCFYVLAITQIMLGWKIASGPDGSFLSFFRFDELWKEHGVVLVASLVMLPVMVWDVLRISHRTAGSIFRLRRAMHSLAAGEQVQPLKFRDSDNRDELAEEFNAVLAYVERLRKQASAAAGSANAAPKTSWRWPPNIEELRRSVRRECGGPGRGASRLASELTPGGVPPMLSCLDEKPVSSTMFAASATARLVAIAPARVGVIIILEARP